MSVNPYDPPDSARLQNGPGRPRTMTVRRIGPLSLAKLQAAIFCVLGLIGAVVWFLFALLGLASGFAAGPDAEASVGLLVGGLVGIVVVTALYALLGFIGGLIVAVLYNLAAGLFGGLEVDLGPAGFGPAD